MFHQCFWVISSVGRALRLHRRCQEFESLITHQPSDLILFIYIKYLVRENLHNLSLDNNCIQEFISSMLRLKCGCSSVG